MVSTKKNLAAENIQESGEDTAQSMGDQRGCQRISEEVLIPQQPPNSTLDCSLGDTAQFEEFIATATRPRSRISVPVDLSIAALDQFDLLDRRERLGKPRQGPKSMSETSLLLCGIRACLHGDAMTAVWCAILLSLRYAGTRHFPASEPFIAEDGKPDMNFEDDLLVIVEFEDGAQYFMEPCEVANSCLSPVDGTPIGLAEILIPDPEAFLDAMRRNALYGGTEWTEDGERMLRRLIDQLHANPPTPNFMSKGLLECEVFGLIRREQYSRLMVSVSHGMQAPLRLVSSTAIMISRLRFPDNADRPERAETTQGTASGTRTVAARNGQSGPQRRETDLAVTRASLRRMTTEWMAEQDARIAAEGLARHAEQKLASVLLAVEASGNTVDITEDGTPVINPALLGKQEIS